MEDAIHARHAIRHESLLTRCDQTKEKARAIVARAREARTHAWQVVTKSVRAKRRARRRSTAS